MKIVKSTRNILLSLFMLLSLSAVAQPDESTLQGQQRMSCTSIMVGKKASADGSVMTSHTCDSWYRTWMRMVPAKDYARDTVTAVYTGRMHTQTADDSTKMYRKGVIPQVRHTFRYLDTAYPCLNEKQLAIGETTVSGRDTLQNKKGMFMVEELERIALERCSTAREAIRLMGDLVKTYGYGDSGECLTIADKNEVWIFEVFGEGPKKALEEGLKIAGELGLEVHNCEGHMGYAVTGGDGDRYLATITHLDVVGAGDGWQADP